MLYSMGCVPLITCPTRYLRKTATLIDHIYTNILNKSMHTYEIVSDISHHLPILALVKNFKPYHSAPPTLLIRDTTNFTVENFLIDLEDKLSELEKYFSLQTAHDLFQKFLNIIKESLQKHAPFKKASHKQQKLRKKPWITRGILKSINHKNKLRQQSLKGDNHTKKTFKVYRNKLTHIKELSKNLYYNELISKSKHNFALIWKSINNITQRTKTKKNNHLVYDSKQICETLNDHFSVIGPRMARNIHPPSNTCKFTNLSLINDSLTSFYVNPISTNEVLRHLNELKLSKSVGSNGIPIRYIKMASCIIAPTLTKLYNYCIEEGTFPNILKIEEVKPIYKKSP